jgi:hypothetical protein
MTNELSILFCDIPDSPTTKQIIGWTIGGFFFLVVVLIVLIVGIRYTID